MTDPTPTTAHDCTEARHHRDEAARLRELLGRLDASSERLSTELERATSTLRDMKSWIDRRRGVHDGLKPAQVQVLVDAIDTELRNLERKS